MGIMPKTVNKVRLFLARQLFRLGSLLATESLLAAEAQKELKKRKNKSQLVLHKPLDAKLTDPSDLTFDYSYSIHPHPLNLLTQPDQEKDNKEHEYIE